MAALVIGAVLLRLRLSAIDALGALTDRSGIWPRGTPSPACFNRRGVEERVAELVATAARHEDVVFAMFVDIDGLKAANDRLWARVRRPGHPRRRRAVRSSMRASDIVGRWGGDEFIVLGHRRAHRRRTQFLERLEGQFSASGIDRAAGPGESASERRRLRRGTFDFDALIAAADADMYAQRRSRRES